MHILYRDVGERDFSLKSIVEWYLSWFLDEAECKYENNYYNIKK